MPGASEEGAVDPAWVTVYRPELAAPGFTLTLHETRIPVLLDLNGRVVHSWPAARVKSRVRLLPDGSILGLGLGRSVVEYDWEGRKTWEYRTPDAIPHHDVIRLANGHTLVLVLREGEGSDTLLEVDRGGRVVWIWRSAERLGALLPARPAHRHDVTHFNSLQELPDNPWHTAGDRRFRPGNLLVSARNLNTLFVIDRPSGKVVWSFSGDLDRQHEAAMNGPGLPGPGLIQIFNNRQGSFQGDHRSEVLELDPRDGRVAWRYQAPGFFSPTGGLQQALPNGNVLITSTRGDRVFEVTRRGEVAWEWAPPYEPVRAVRIGPGFCPQLARLTGASGKAVVPPAGYLYVDPDAYRFARQGSRAKAVVAGEPRTVLKAEDDCRDLTLPAAAAVQVGYGIDRERWKAAGAGRPVVFTLSLTSGGGDGQAVELLRDAVAADGPAWRERTLRLDAYARREVRLCVEIDGPGLGSGGERFAWWAQPLIAVRGQKQKAESDADDDAKAPGDLTPEELEVRRKHLKALGYVN